MPPEIHREWVPTFLSGPDTHQNPQYALLWARYARKATQTLDYEFLALDAFAKDCPWAEPLTNDLDPEARARYTQDALEWLRSLKTAAVAIALLDPPFSDVQAERTYGSPNLYTKPGYMAGIGEEIGRIVVPGGYVIKCGYNTNPPSPLFSLREVRICHYGGNRNDVLISVWRKDQHSLDLWLE